MGKETFRTHKDLLVWQRALCLAESIYVATRSFPVEERYGLSLQMRRAAVSIISNIAEGAGRRTRAEYLNFLHIARGSWAELDSQLILAVRLSFGAGQLEAIQREIERVGPGLSQR